MKQLFSLFRLSVFVLSVFVLASCQTGNMSPSSDEQPTIAGGDKGDPVAIRVVTSYGSDDGNRANYENAYKAYEAATGNTVQDDSAASNETWKASVMASFDTDEVPDVLFFFTGADADKLILENHVVSLDEIRAVYPDYAANMKDHMLPKSPVDGQSYAVPVNGYWEGLYVNKKVLADCGVAVPDAHTTWDQFLEACQQIADRGYVPIAASLNEIPHYWFEFCVFNNGTVASHPLLPAAATDPIGLNWTAGINDMKALYERGFFPSDTTTTVDSETNALMITDKAAFMIDGSWKMGWFTQNAANIDDFTVTYVPGKLERRATDTIGGISMGYYITRSAWENPEKRAACVAFVSAMTTDAVVATFGLTAVTALKQDMVPPANASGIVKDALAMVSGCTEIVAATGDGLSADARRDLFDNIKNVVSGALTAQEAIDHCLSIVND